MNEKGKRERKKNSEVCFLTDVVVGLNQDTKSN
jgi:hypothetical protein